jgi:hypothetical protein
MEESNIYLYIKTHNKTGLKYFGKTVLDPYSYYGSGKYWKNHLKKYGYDITTEIYGYYTDKNKCIEDAIKFSKENNIVESKEWANLMIESLDGGDTSKTDGYIKSFHKIGENGRKSKWWNNGKKQTFSQNPPDETYVRGRLPFNNVGAKIGANIQKGKIWVNNGLDEMMTYVDKIPVGYVKGRLKSKVFKIRHSAKGTYWWNNGIEECMSINPPDSSYMRGRIKKI